MYRYKHSVQKASIVRSLALSVTQSLLLDTVSSDGVEYVCNTCSKYLRRNQIPPCAIANNLQFPAVPSHLPTLTVAEWRLLSPRLAFMQIHEAAVGKQLRIHGNVVCVPADVCTTVNNLPRTSSDLETVAIQLKRRSQYQHAFLTSNVRPECIRQVGTYLVDNGELFKHENISFSQQLLQSIRTTENSNISQTSDNTHQLPVTQLVETACCSTVTSESLSSVGKDEEVDSWIEIQDTEIEHAGIFLQCSRQQILLKIQKELLCMVTLTLVTVIGYTALLQQKVIDQSVYFLMQTLKNFHIQTFFGVMLVLKVTQLKFITAAL